MSIVARTAAVLGIVLVASWLSTPSRAAAQGAGAVPLTTETLGTMLENLGLEVKPWDNKKGYGVTLKEDTWTFSANASISSTGATLWLSIPLDTIEDPAKVKIAPIFGLLTENDTIGPLFFSYSTSAKRIYLNHALPNSGVTPARLRKELGDMTAVLKRTTNLWDARKW